MSLRPFAVPRHYAALLLDYGPNLQALFGNVFQRSDQSAIASPSEYFVDRKVREEQNVTALTRLLSTSQPRRYRQISAINSEL